MATESVIADMPAPSRLFRGVLMYYEEGESVVKPDPDWTISITELGRRRNGSKFRMTATSVTGETLTWPEDAARLLAVIPERYIPPFILDRRLEIPTQDALPF